MPTARELLEQVDALMRRNRALAELADIPELTDVVSVPVVEAPAAPVDVSAPVRPARESEPATTTDAMFLEGEPSVWLDEAALGEASITGPAPDSILADVPVPPEPDVVIADVPMLPEPEVVIADVPVPLEPDSVIADGPMSPEPAPVAPPGHDEDPARWAALAEEIRMQVLQRIDIFTDTGLKEHLKERLQPVVDRASAELVGTISVHVGQLLRAYVAEAIEREIEKFRDGAD